MQNRLRVYLFVIVVLFGAGALFRSLLPSLPIEASTVWNVLAFSAFLVAIEVFEIRATSGSARWLPTVSLDIAAWVLFGPAVTMIIEALAIAVGDGFVKRRPLVRTLFNTATTCLGAGVAGVVYHALPFSDRLTTPLFLLPALVSHLVFALTVTALMAFVMSLSEARRFVEVLRSLMGWHFFTGFVASPISAFLVFSFSFAGTWSLILFAIPIWVVHQAHNIFEKMKRSHKEIVAALTTALEADEPYTHGHSHRVARYAVQIGRRMNLSPRDLETLEYAGLLHDIGKIAITNDIVCKPARLSKDEFDILSSHPEIGSEIVEQMEFLNQAADMVRHHHERPDGQGYPDGLKGDQISLGSHILNLCDAIDAMCSNRPYRAALTLDQCMEEVRRFRGSQFDERVVDTFVQLVEEGSFKLILQNDENAQGIQRVIREAAAKAEEERRRDGNRK